jgi:hypothetical protein
VARVRMMLLYTIMLFTVIHRVYWSYNITIVSMVHALNEMLTFRAHPLTHIFFFFFFFFFFLDICFYNKIKNFIKRIFFKIYNISYSDFCAKGFFPFLPWQGVSIVTIVTEVSCKHASQGWPAGDFYSLLFSAKLLRQIYYRRR